MIGKVRLIAALILAFACVCMWGCGDSDYREWGGRYGGILVSIINDSLALLTNSRGYEDCHEVFMGSADCERGGTNDGLFLVNYRKKQLPYWGDTTNGHLYLIDGFYRDSVVLFSNDREEFGFWKIGGQPRIVRKWNCEAPCDCDDGMYHRKSARPWIDGNVLIKMEWKEECPYAILDTATGIVQKLEFTGEYTWLKGCDDIMYIDGDVVCLRQRGDRLCEIDFEKKEGVVDSLIKSEWMLFDPPKFYGNAVKMKASSFDKNDHAFDFGDRLALIGKNGFVFEGYPEIWMKYNSFVDSAGSSISYSSEDLVVTR